MATQCPICGETKERVSQHWALSSCGYPEISDRLREIVDGLVLAGATITGNGNNPHLEIGTTSEPLARWTAEALDWLHHGTREESIDNGGIEYRIRTPAHPGLARYERWDKAPESKGRVPPEEFSITPRTGRVWWAFSGGLEWTGEWNASRVGVVSALYDDRAAWIQRLFASVDIETTRVDKRVRLSHTAVSQWLAWIGDPVPGVEYKWTDSVVVYRALRSDPRSDAEFRAELSKTALRIARERTDKDLDPNVFDARIDVVDADTVADVLGGGDWDAALRIAGVDREMRTIHDGYDSVRMPIQDGYDGARTPLGEGDAHEQCLTALQTVAERLDDEVTRSTYDEHRDADHPSSSTITYQYGSWNAAKEAAGLGVQHTGRPQVDEQEIITSLRAAADDLGHPPKMLEYREQGRTPATTTIYRMYGGWDEALSAAGLTDEEAG